MAAVRIILALLLFVFTSISSQAQVADESLIVPGVRIGKYPLESSVADLTRLVGYGPRAQFHFTGNSERMIITNSQGPYTRFSWFLERPDASLSASFRDPARIETLSLSWYDDAKDQPEFKTERGITFRARRSDVEAAYGPPTWDDSYGVNTRGDPCAPPAPGCRPFTFTAYNSVGIAFWFDENELLGTVYLFRSGSAPNKHTYRTR